MIPSEEETIPIETGAEEKTDQIIKSNSKLIKIIVIILILIVVGYVIYFAVEKRKHGKKQRHIQIID